MTDSLWSWTYPHDDGERGRRSSLVEAAALAVAKVTRRGEPIDPDAVKELADSMLDWVDESFTLDEDAAEPVEATA
jgi:hypothetical protein